MHSFSFNIININFLEYAELKKVVIYENNIEQKKSTEENSEGSAAVVISTKILKSIQRVVLILFMHNENVKNTADKVK